MAEVIQIRRERRRRESLTDEKKTEIVKRVCDFYQEDLTARTDEADARMQRQAKYRMWTSGPKEYPWPDASDVAIPDLMTHSLRVQDTLVNAVMSAHPAIVSKALHREDKDKQDSVDNLIHHQLFTEADFEETAGDGMANFVNDGVVTFFIPWVREKRETVDVKRFPPIPDEMMPVDFFRAVLSQTNPEANAVPTGTDDWDWLVQEEGEDPISVSFYTRRGETEMVSKRLVQVFDGPRPMVKDWDDVLHPARCANLQIPSPSNPGGAPHVILRDFPTIDEIKRLAKSGFYDISKKDLEALENHARSGTDEEEKKQKDTFQGVEESPTKSKAKSHTRLTRLMCFDLFAMNDDGMQEDMIWWVIEEADLLVKWKRLTEMYPAIPPRRPFAEKPFLPVPGRRVGISLLEMMEGLHDARKMAIDQTTDGAAMRIHPPMGYRASASIKPEVMRYGPGDMLPFADPTRDFNVFNMPHDVASGINLYTLLEQDQERLTMTGDLQFGRVPEGRSAALRTVGGMQLLAGQGEARPERILRRAFSALTEIWHQVHELNQAFLPREKQILVVGLKPEEDPYKDVSPGEIKGRFQFDFRANAFNASKLALQQALQEIGVSYFNELSFSLGIVNAEGYYRYLRDVGMAWGQDPDQYLVSPPEDFLQTKILAEEALHAIISGGAPEGVPLEGAVPHLQKLIEFAQSDDFGVMDETQRQAFDVYLQKVRERAEIEARNQQIAGAAAQRGGPQGQPGRPTENVPPSLAPPQVNNNEFINETLPGAGGGGNGAA